MVEFTTAFYVTQMLVAFIGIIGMTVAAVQSRGNFFRMVIYFIIFFVIFGVLPFQFWFGIVHSVLG